MCGRYAASAAQDGLIEIFEIDEVPASDDPQGLRPNWNIAPTDPVATIVERLDKASGEAVRKLVTPRWGLVPSWSKDAAGAARLINARAETVAEKPSFRKAFASRRCLLPADGYYEWYGLTEADGTPVKQKGRQVKQPFYIHPVASHESGAQPTLPGMANPLMVMAGIYEFWRNEALPPEAPDAWLTTCCIITTQATDELGVIHDRMPMQVARDDWAAWLDPHLDDPRAAHELMHVPTPDEMTAYAVSRLVNTVGNNGPELVAPLPTADAPVEETLV